MNIVEHILAMANDAYLTGHPEWNEIVKEAQRVQAQATLDDFYKHNAATTADEFFKRFTEAIQPAEEMGGPEGPEYMQLMLRIANEAMQRVVNYQANT